MSSKKVTKSSKPSEIKYFRGLQENEAAIEASKKERMLIKMGIEELCKSLLPPGSKLNISFYSNSWSRKYLQITGNDVFNNTRVVGIDLDRVESMSELENKIKDAMAKVQLLIDNGPKEQLDAMVKEIGSLKMRIESLENRTFLQRLFGVKDGGMAK